MNKKTNTQRIQRIYQLCEDHFGNGTVRFVGIKFEPAVGFVAKVKFYDQAQQLSIVESADCSTEALRKLKNRIKKIIKRYNGV